MEEKNISSDVVKKTNWNEYRYKDDLITKIWEHFQWKGYERLLKKAQIDKVESVLELGCGTGEITYNLNREYNLKKIALVDFNENSIEYCKKRFSNVKNTRFLKEDFLKLKLKEKFDLVHSAGVFEHFNKKEQLKIMKIHVDLTKEKKHIIIFVPTPTSAYNFWRSIGEKTGTWIFHDEKPLVKDEIIKLSENFNLNYITHTCLMTAFLTHIGIIFQKRG